MEEWKEYKLEETTDFIAGYAFKSKDFGSYENKVVKIKDIQPPFVSIASIDGVNIHEYDISKLAKYLVYKNDFLLAMTGATIGKIGRYIYDKPVYLNQRVLKFMPKVGFDSDFIYYSLISDSFQKFIINHIDSDSAQPNISANTIGKYRLYIPDITIQKKISHVLKVLDSKIELNRRINDNLEQQAQALFDYYFSADSKYLSDSERGVLTNIAVYLNGLAMQKFPPTDSEHSLPVLKIKELGQGKCDNNSDRCSNDIDSNYVIDNGNIIFSWSGTLMVDVWCGGKCGLNQHLFKVTPLQDYPQWFIYYWTIRHLNTFKLIAKDKAVTMGHIKRVDLEKAEVIIPNKYSLVEMNAQIEPLYQSIINNRLQIAELETLRDALLPKLMSGELKINDLNC